MTENRIAINPPDEDLAVAHIVRHTGYQVCRGQPGRLC
jgi:hypothetical protein